ncbi:MAG TPA: ABC transporter permease [Planctomycetota bacterium]
MKRWLLVLGIYAAVAVCAAFGVLGADPMRQDGARLLEPPGAHALLGTDHLGRDVFAQTLHGARVALLVGGFAAGLAVALGAGLGVLAGWRRGWFDALAGWLAGAVAAVPSVLLILGLAQILGRGFAAVYLAVGLASWVQCFRIVRAETLRLADREFVLAARAAGASDRRILLHHLLPNLAPLLLVQFALHFVFAVKVEVVVSFLGLGLPLGAPSWGAMIGHAPDDLAQHVWWPLAAATLAMAGLVLAVHRLADGLRERLDPAEAPAA